MSQNAIVKKVVQHGVVEVSLMRQMECGLSCSGCEGCPQKPQGGDPGPGQRSAGGGQAGGLGGGGRPPPAAPSASPFWSFCSPASVSGRDMSWARLLGLGDGASIGMAAAGLVLGFVPAVLLNRTITRRKTRNSPS